MWINFIREGTEKEKPDFRQLINLDKVRNINVKENVIEFWIGDKPSLECIKVFAGEKSFEPLKTFLLFEPGKLGQYIIN